VRVVELRCASVPDRRQPVRREPGRDGDGNVGLPLEAAPSGVTDWRVIPAASSDTMQATSPAISSERDVAPVGDAVPRAP
jgi:hypothetical protein